MPPGKSGMTSILFRVGDMRMHKVCIKFTDDGKNTFVETFNVYHNLCSFKTCNKFMISSIFRIF